MISDFLEEEALQVGKMAEESGRGEGRTPGGGNAVQRRGRSRTGVGCGWRGGQREGQQRGPVAIGVVDKRAVRLLLDGRCLLSNHAVENAEKPDVLEQRNDLEAGSVNRVRPVVMPGSPVTCGCCYK